MECSQPSEAKFYDIIYELSRKLLDHVVENIFSFLDVEGIRSSELVSKGWRQAILSTRAWSKILQRQINDSDLWLKAFNGLAHDIDSWEDKKKCLAILNSFKVIESNWRSGKCNTTKHVIETFQLAPAVTLCCTSHSFQMNSRYIFPGVGPLNHWNTIAFTDRQTMQISKAVHLRNVLYHCEANETLAFFGYYDGILSVFDIDSGQEVHQLRELKGSAIVGLKLHKKTLVTLSFIDGPNPEDKLLTIWNIEGPTQVEMKAQIPLKIWKARLELDEHFVVVLMDTGAYVISCITNKLIRKLDFRPQTIEAQYRCGMLLTLEVDNDDQLMRFVDASTGACLRLFNKIEPSVISFRANSKFIVLLGDNGTLEIIDMNSAIQQDATWNQSLVATVHMNCTEVSAFHVDDFQVVAFGGLLICLDFTNWIRKPIEDH